MPGDPWQKLANLRLLYGWMYGQPGKKLLFMGAELAQEREWNHDSSLDWHLLQNPGHAGIQRWLEDLNRFYREEPALHELDSNPDGFEWVDANDADNSVLSFLRWGKDRRAPVLVLYNFTPIARDNYRVGVPSGGYWRELLNSDSPDYGGSGRGNLGGVDAVPIPLHGRPYSLTLSLPPLAVLFLQPATPATVAVPEAPPAPEPELELESDPEPEPEEPSTPETPETPEEPEAPPSPS
jgi:1,4-alpha-glucan branching enzyme